MNITYHPESPVAVCTWDWKEQPDMALIFDTLNRFSGQGHNVKLVNVETESDENCCVICPTGTTEEEARSHWLREDLYQDGLTEADVCQVYASREGDWCHIVADGHEEYSSLSIPMSEVPLLIEYLKALLPETRIMLT
jgi:hypothetical protein